MVKKPLIALTLVAILVVTFAVCLVSAVQLLEPRNMPFGVTQSSPVVDDVQKKYSLDIHTYDSESDLRAAAERGDINGGYVVGSTTDTLITVPAKSFFGEIYVRAGFADAAKTAGRTFTTDAVAPLPTYDRTGAVIGLLLVPTLLGGYLIASLLYSTSKTAAAPGRISLVLAFAAAGAVVTWVAAGPLLGAIPTDGTLALIPCFFLVTAAVALSAVALQALVGPLGTLLAALLFIMIGGAGAGGGGVALLPTYWQTLGNLFPPRHAIELYRNVRYFGGNNIALPIAVLSLYALLGVAVLVLKTRKRPRRDMNPDTAPTDARTDARTDAPATSDPVDASPSRRLVPKDLAAPVVFAFLLTTLFAVNYTSSGHEPVASDMPFGVVGSTTLADKAQGPLFSLDVTTYDTQDDATAAMDRGEIYGAFIATSSPAEVIVVPSMSALAPLDIAKNFEQAAASTGDTISVKSYTPTPLAPKDPFALVLATVLIALLVGGYTSAAMLASTVGTSSGRWRGLWLLGFSAVTALAVDLAVTYWLEGIPKDAFWVTWPILTLIILVVALFTAVLRRLLGPAGVVVTLLVILQFGNPSSGGSNGATYLPSFWNQIGPFLPPRNDFLLLRNAIYFDGHGIGQPLAVLLAYAVVTAVILGFLDWFRSPEPTIAGLDDDDTAGAAVVAIPVGPVA